MAVQVVILAAGQGKRMHSTVPKGLHRLGGVPILQHVIRTAIRVGGSVPPIVVVGHQSKLLREQFAGLPIRFVEQKEQLGTGHAVLQALEGIDAADWVLVLSGDVPLISEATLNQLIAATTANSIGMLTVSLDNPTGYGRIKRDKAQHIKSIVEEKDASATERAIKEINPGIYLAEAKHLKKWLPTFSNDNAQGEYYLTDIISAAVKEKMTIQTVQPAVVEEVFGVNDRVQLAQLERFYQRQQAEAFMRQGVTLLDPARFDVRGDAQIGSDVVIDVNVILEGKVVIGNNCSIGPNVVLRNVVLGDRVEVKANSVLDGADVAAECLIGPFARLRPGTILAAAVHVGNFVEIKNSVVDASSKINHLSYIGDSSLGKHVNIGAGTITCNYDGVNKHKTIIGDHVHVGSCTQLVAPVTIGMGATIGAGSTVTKDAPANELTLTHKLEQRSIKNWQRGGNA